jgi:hypothetical protein
MLLESEIYESYAIPKCICNDGWTGVSCSKPCVHGTTQEDYFINLLHVFFLKRFGKKYIIFFKSNYLEFTLKLKYLILFKNYLFSFS